MGKVASLSDALALVEDGAHLALTGFAITRNAVAATGGLIRAGRRDLTLTQVSGGLETDLLVGSGCVRRLLYSGGSLDRFGPLHSVNRAIAGGLAVEEYSTLSLTLRVLAGSLGLPFVPTSSLIGSQLLASLVKSGGVKMIEDPFGKGPVLVAALCPDVAILHADLCDEEGNAVVFGPRWSLKETALASAAVIVTTERLVRLGEIDPSQVTIPGTVVAAVVEAPGGARPTAVYRSYDYDGVWLEAHVRASRKGGETFRRFVEERVLDAAVMP